MSPHFGPMDTQRPGVVGKLQKLASVFPQIVEKALNAGASLVVREVQMKHLSGQTLHRRSHRLFRSIAKCVEVKGNTITAEVESNVVYARIHEYGGEIRPKNKPYLAFKIGNDWVRTLLVRMPARPYLRPSVEAKKPEVMALIRERIMDAYVGRA